MKRLGILLRCLSLFGSSGSGSVSVSGPVSVSHGFFQQRYVLLVLWMAITSPLFSAESIGGFWKTIDDKTGRAECVIAVYEYEGLYYGRIIGTFDEDGKMNDSIYSPIKRAPGVAGNPFYSGLDIIWDLEDS